MKKENHIEKKDKIWRMRITAKNHYELGRKHGELLRKAKHPCYKLFKKKIIQKTILLLYNTRKKTFKKLRIQKKYLDEIKGISNATNIPFRVLFFINFAFDVYKRNIMCSTFTYFNEEETIIGRNTDIKEWLARLALKYEASIITRIKINNKEYTHISFPLVIGVLNGYNEHGITTNPHMLYGVKNGKLRKESTPIMLLLKDIMENTKTINETKTIFRKNKTTRAVTALITSTKEKKSYIYEAHPNKINFINNQKNHQACTMHYEGKEMKKLQTGTLEGTKKRLKYLEETLKKTKKMTTKKAKEILRNTKEGTKRTKSGGVSITNNGTFQSLIFIPEKDTTYYSNGQKTPVSTTGEYKEIKF